MRLSVALQTAVRAAAPPVHNMRFPTSEALKPSHPAAFLRYHKSCIQGAVPQDERRARRQEVRGRQTVAFLDTACELGLRWCSLSVTGTGSKFFKHGARSFTSIMSPFVVELPLQQAILLSVLSQAQNDVSTPC
jgi:hypothetical protein